MGSGNHGYWLGSYEYHVCKALAEFLFTGMTFYDIGANVGYFTLLGSRLVGEPGHVVAFEPVPRNMKYLKEHISINGIENAILLEAAVSNTSGIVTFAEGSNPSMGTVSSEGVLEVSSVTLDGILQSRSIPKPDVIKMDIEGGELDALRGAVELLRVHRPVLFLATHGDEVRRECLAFLDRLSYRTSSLAGQPDELIAVS